MICLKGENEIIQFKRPGPNVVICAHYNHWLPKLLKVGAITFGDHVYFRDYEWRVTDALRYHEAVHVQQYHSYGFLRFLCIYIRDYIRGRFVGLTHDQAYKAIRFEVDARHMAEIQSTEEGY
jgi:hypothetical protein